jgi:hypothetical protein
MLRKMVVILLWVILSATYGFAGLVINDGLSREHIVRPGEKAEGKIILRNTADTSQEVKIYQTDYQYSANGEVAYGEPGSLARSNAGWISLSPIRLTIPPKESVSVYYTIQMPDRPDLKGTYWSMVMVEPYSERTIETNGKNQFGIQTIIRYGIQMVTDIGPVGTRQIRFLDKRLIYEKEKRMLQIDIDNTGERQLYPFMWVELYDEQGGKAGRFEGEKLRIYPGCSIRQRVDLTGVSKGKYKALVVVDNGDDYVVGAQYDMRFD